MQLHLLRHRGLRNRNRMAAPLWVFVVSGVDVCLIVVCMNDEQCCG